MPVARPRINYWRDDGWLHRQQTHRRHGSAVGHRGSYDVVLSNSRGPQALKDLVKELRPHARAATSAGAAAEGDLVVVVVSIPPRAYPAVPEKPLAGGSGHDQLHAATRWADTRARWLALQQRGAPAAPRYGARGRGVQQDHLLDLASLPVRRARPTVAPCRSPGTTRPRRRR
jgi:hypothetical protein